MSGTPTQNRAETSHYPALFLFLFVLQIFQFSPKKHRSSYLVYVLKYTTTKQHKCLKNKFLIFKIQTVLSTDSYSCEWYLHLSSCTMQTPLKLSLSESFFPTFSPTKYNPSLTPRLLTQPLCLLDPFINLISTITISRQVTITSCDSDLDQHIPLPNYSSAEAS